MIDNWRKSSCSANNASCVETGWTADVVGYRDTKHPEPVLIFSRDAVRVFLLKITESADSGSR